MATSASLRPKHAKDNNRKQPVIAEKAADTQTDTPRDPQTDRQTYRPIYRHIDRQAESQTDIQTHRQTDRQADEHTSRFTNRHLGGQIYVNERTASRSKRQRRKPDIHGNTKTISAHKHAEKQQEARQRCIIKDR